MNSHLHHLKSLLRKLGIAFILFSLCRILFYLFNTVHFNNVSFSLFLSGIRFDIVAISFLFAPLIILQLIPFPFRYRKWYQICISTIFYLSIILSLALNLIDVAYFDFTLKRTTSDFFGMIGTGNDFWNLLPHYIIDFWYNYLLFFGLILLTWFLHKRYSKSTTLQTPYKGKEYLIHTSIFIVFFGFTIIGMRGGVQYKPIGIVNAGQYSTAQNTSIVLNTPFTILKTLSIDHIEEVSYFSETEINTIYTPLTNIENSNPLKGKNVVIIILESFAKEYVGGLNDGKGYTPFLDSLLTESYVFTNAYANGQRSIEALPCILSGLPQLMAQPYVLSMYGGNKLDGLPGALKEEGYSTSFYHGGANGTMGFNGFVGSTGIDDYYGMNEYPNKKNDFDGLWGIFDEPYLQYYASELNKKSQPFFSTLFTVSSHHPYTIPKEHVSKFPKGDLPLHETIGYTDYALKRFFNTAQKMPWFDNTIFVFTADHSSESNDPKYKTILGRFAVPTFIYAPGTNLIGYNNDYFQHIDITPTLLGLLGINESIISFGNDAFSATEKFSVGYSMNLYQITYNNHFLVYDGENTIGYYSVNYDSLLRNNLINKLNPLQLTEKNKTEKLLKAIIQQYNNRLINNELHFSN